MKETKDQLKVVVIYTDILHIVIVVVIYGVKAVMIQFALLLHHVLLLLHLLGEQLIFIHKQEQHIL
jgi:hypothetical protein